MIVESLAGKRVAVTGATGFLGTALVERLVRTVPDCEVITLIRPGRRTTVADRLRKEVLRNDCFDRLRRESGEQFEELVSARVTAVAGDVGTDGLGLNEEDLALFASCDVVIHSAATVSFDSPLDSAVEVNLLGPSRVAGALQDALARGLTDHLPHLIAVSTAYVAGSRRGDAPEALLTETPFSPDIDWRGEVTAARRARGDTEAKSRTPRRLAEFQQQARHELGAAGTPLLGERTERLREDWVKEQLVETGRARAQSLGWPDAYAYTKALGERALLQNRGDVPVTFVRPSIIESATAEPHAGWIRGFRMAEPVIISYGRGLLKDFPGIPEGVVDVIPVDLVVAAIVAVAAKGPDPDGPSVYQVASGSRNPLRQRELVRLVKEWFTDHPLYDANGQPIVVPEWSYTTRGKVKQQLERINKVLTAGEKVIGSLPVRGQQAQLSARLEESRALAERALSYVELYGAYAETEATFRVDRLLDLWHSLDDTDRVAFPFDPIVVDWSHYVQVVHLPSIVSHARVRTSPGKGWGGDRATRSRKAILAPERHLAAFDLENTLIASNVVESFSWLATRHMDLDERMRFTFRTLKEAPSLLAMDRRDRGDFLRYFYRRYEGAPVNTLRDDAWEMFSHMILAKAFPAGLRRVREHRALGHRTVLITGALDFNVAPLRPLFDDIVCVRLGERDGKFTGELITSPLTGEARALVIAEYADAEGLRLDESIAYADSASDLPMLEAVGFPVAVNPEAKLATIARKRGWHVEQWAKAPGDTRPFLPIAPLRKRNRA